MILDVKCEKKTLWYQAVWYNQHFSPFCIQSRTYFSKINRFCVEYLRNLKLSRLEIQLICISILFSYIFIGKLRTNLGSLLVVLSKHFSSAVCRKALGDFIYTVSLSFSSSFTFESSKLTSSSIVSLNY